MLEQQTSVTVGSAASRLQEKDAKVKAANIRIKALEKDLQDSAARIAEFEEHSSKNNQESSDEAKKLQIELLAQQKEVAVLTAKCIPLEKLCAKLSADLEDKDAAAAAAQALVKAVDKNRLRELEQLGNVLAAQKKDHSKELAGARGELGALQSQLESVRASHQAEIESTRRNMQKQHEELLAENEFAHIADRNNQLQELRKGIEAAHSLERSQVESMVIKLKEQHSDTLDKLRIALEDEMRVALSTQQEEMSAKYSTSMQSSLSSSMADVAKKKQAEYDAKEAVFEKILRASQSSAEEAMKSLGVSNAAHTQKLIAESKTSL